MLRKALTSIAVVTVLSLLAATVSAQSKKKTLAVLPLTGVGVEQRITVLLTDLLTVRVSELGTYEVLATDEINAMIGMEKVKEVAGCDNVACAAQIAGMLGVDEMVTGNVGRLGDKLNLKLTLFDAAAMKVLKRSLKIVKNDENLFEGVVLEALSELCATNHWQAQIAELKAAAASAPTSQPTTPAASTTPSDQVIRSTTSLDEIGICQKGDDWWFCQGQTDIKEGRFARMYSARMGQPNPLEKYDTLQSWPLVFVSGLAAFVGVAWTVIGLTIGSGSDFQGTALGVGIPLALVGTVCAIMFGTVQRDGFDPASHDMKLDEARFYVEQYNNKEKGLPTSPDGPPAEPVPTSDNSVHLQFGFSGTGFGLMGTF